MEEQEEDLNYGRLLENAPEALVLVNTDGEIRYVNTHTEQLFGYDDKDLVGKQIEALLPARYRENHVIHRDGYMLDPRLRRMGQHLEHIVGLHRDGGEFPVEVNLAPLPGGYVVAAIRLREDEWELPKKRKPSAASLVPRSVALVLVVQLVINLILYVLLAKGGHP